MPLEESATLPAKLYSFSRRVAARNDARLHCSSFMALLVHCAAYRPPLSADEAEDIVQEVFVGLPPRRLLV